MDKSPDRKGKEDAMSAEMLVEIPVGTGGKKFKTCLGLVDSGASSSLANVKLVTSRSGAKKTTKSTTWQTKTCTFKTNKSVKLENLRLPQFTTKRIVNTEFHLFDKGDEDKYDSSLAEIFYSTLD